MARNRNQKPAETVTVEGLVEVMTETTVDLDAVLASLEAGGDMVVDIETPVSETIDEDTAALDSAIEAIERREAGYEEQTSEINTRSDEEIAVEKASEAPVTKVAKVREIGFDVQADLLPFLRSYAKTHDGIVLDSDKGELDDAGIEALAASITQKKVRAKAANILTNAAGGRKLETFTAEAMKLMVASYLGDGEPVSKKAIFGAYKARGNSDGTAASQSGQIMSLFPAIGIATKVDGGLKPNPASVLLEHFAQQS